MNLSVHVWIRDAADMPSTSFAVREAGKKALDGAGVEIPFPHLQLFVDDVKEPVWNQVGKVAGRSAS